MSMDSCNKKWLDDVLQSDKELELAIKEYEQAMKHYHNTSSMIHSIKNNVFVRLYRYLRQICHF